MDEYLEFAACLKKLPKAEQKDAIQEVMELVKITDVRKRLIRNLSKPEGGYGPGYFREALCYHPG